MKQIVFIFDDITAAVTKQRDRETPGGIGPIAEIMYMGQALKIGVILIVHTLSGISDVIRQNVETFFVFGVAGEDPRTVSNILGTNAKHMEQMRVLRPGEFVCFNPLLWPQAVYCTFMPPQMPATCSEEVRKRVLAKFTAGISTSAPAPLSAFLPKTAQATPSPTEKAKPALPNITAEQMTFMMIAITGLPRTVGNIYKEMRLSNTQGSRISKKLDNILGLIRLHEFSTGRVGGKPKLVEITESGWNILQSKGFNKPQNRTKGGWEHEVAARFIEHRAKQRGYRVYFEVDYHGVRADVTLTDPKTGQHKIINIGVSQPAREVEAIKNFFALPISKTSQFVLVARDSDFKKKTLPLLKKANFTSEDLKKIPIKLIADFITT